MSMEFIPGIMNFSLGNGLCIYQGSTWEIPVTVCGIEDKEILPVSLEGYTGRSTIKVNAGDKEVIASPKVTIVDPLQGLLNISLTDEETALIPAAGETYGDTTMYQYDVYLDDENGRSYRILQGYVEVSPTISEEV